MSFKKKFLSKIVITITKNNEKLLKKNWKLGNKDSIKPKLLKEETTIILKWNKLDESNKFQEAMSI
ncbi:hypothetical protein [Methanobrevibacter sp.]|uniref:hypothetical protein n=1 Tax=Methanobrevibacter sp. TaxID=66852 RepID=UPI0025FD8895|nr:hypothetical protein [Methanobrevibacter sp.]MBQ6512905.1 hypothetical protein [Methanobrevibacter sp.]